MEWQKIETAPKDGTVVLGFDPSWYEIAIAMEFDQKRGRWRFFQIMDEIFPTHWMPLPDAPKENQNA